ncbi:YDG/SRA domain-containing protein [uncultured Leifsonia sp.]|uniref:YDG/SRA domain-containing protein n=1 Tax=uncultured Leifsonia sp. TaxID=340359 RepID=UPI0025E724E1|nr:YDG/SRA domain-containing protein [uncultured Leifsonia sp.]
MTRFFGTPDGVLEGHWFASREALRAAGVHAGISGTKADGADSIVVSGGYVDDEDFGDYIIYTGHGGRDQRTGRQIKDQSPDAPGNAGLITSWLEGLPVRVTRGSNKDSSFAPDSGYLYAGLFTVTGHWPQAGADGFVIQRFRLDALDGNYDHEAGGVLEADPSFSTTTISRRIRDSAAVRRVKRLYDDSCQICGTRIIGSQGRSYSEGAHVRPLGRPHLGPDTESNLLCLCPNHHTQLDIGGIVIMDDMRVITVDGVEAGKLTFRGSHRLDPPNLSYQRTLWVTARGSGAG